VDLVVAAIGALDDSIVGSIVHSIVGSIVYSIVGDRSLFVLFSFSVVDDRSAVAGTIIYIALITLPARLQEDGEVLEHFPFRNIVICPPKSNRLINMRESQKVEVWRAST